MIKYLIFVNNLLTKKLEKFNEITKEKIKLVEEKNITETLTQYISKDQLEKRWGGFLPDLKTNLREVSEDAHNTV